MIRQVFSEKCAVKENRVLIYGLPLLKLLLGIQYLEELTKKTKVRLVGADSS
jgi:hypothetical protein